jgi:hypothetical protein
MNFDCHNIAHMKNNEELKEIVETLSKQGWNPMVCDTPIGISNNSVKCGIPTEIGDENIDDYWWLPKSLTDMHPELMIRADGDSMIDAGYEDGDLLRIRFGVTFHDGDNVLAWIDGQCTVKTLFTDEEGMRWLVPQNDSYDAILLKEEMDVRILGVVLGVEKASVRASSRKAISSILRTKKKLKTARNLSTKQVDEQLIRIGEYVQHARQWYAVMRAMADAEVQDESDFDGFCSRICLLLPQHKHLPDAKELQRMAVLSFAKQVAMWVECDAPVTGKRFRDYLAIAKCMAGFLSNEAA